MNKTLPAIAFSALVIIALVLGYLIGYSHGRESENTVHQPPARQPDSADYKRGA